jgi:methionine synthase I (cobalamin-dependent)
MALSLKDYRDKLFIADGDWRAELLRRGWPAERPMEQANLDKPDIVRDIAEAFLDAGATILVTNTAGANRAILADDAECGPDTHADCTSINRRGAELCRAAAPVHPNRKPLVFGAMGNPRKLLMLGEIDEKTLSQAYHAQAHALAEGGVDALICRQFREMQALRLAVLSARITSLPVVACMTFDCGADYMETSLGATVSLACEVLAEAGAAAIGCDGGENPDALPAIVAAIRKRWDGPIWVTANAGVPVWVDGKVTYPDRPEDFAARLKPLRDAGANFIGGGRGAGTDHIAALAKAMKSKK